MRSEGGCEPDTTDAAVVRLARFCRIGPSAHRMRAEPTCLDASGGGTWVTERPPPSSFVVPL